MKFTLLSVFSLIALVAAHPQGAAAPPQPQPPASPAGPGAGAPGAPGGPAGPSGPSGPAGPGLPSCGLSLLAPAFQKSGCGNSDKQCLCASADLKQVFTSGVSSACPNQGDKQAYQSFFTSLCGQ